MKAELIEHATKELERLREESAKQKEQDLATIKEFSTRINAQEQQLKKLREVVDFLTQVLTWITKPQK
jgi:hypothetical protein